MKFATFNLYQFLKPPFFWYERLAANTYTAEEWEQKRHWVLQRLRQMDADVVGFQEVFSVPELKALAEQAGYTTFIHVDEPAALAEDAEVYIKPVVALAAKFPIQGLQTVSIPAAVLSDLRLTSDFHFSRQPICVTFDAPDLGVVQAYVVHLKSKRPILPPTEPYPDDMPWLDRIQHTMQQLSRGNIAALLQRGAEATILYHHISEALLNQERLSVVVMGDLNDEEQSIPVAALTMSDRVYEAGGVDYTHWPEEAKGYLHRFRLQDTFNLALNMRNRKRPYTHIFRGDGTVLDYILVSNNLSSHNPNACAEVAHYQVLHDHLDNDGIPNRLQSDHGQVKVDIRSVVDYSNLPEVKRTIRLPTSLDTTAVMTRQDFIDLAGGIFQSAKHFSQWDAKDKWEHFWSFFFDTEHGWVPAIYGITPVDELYQKQRHSIEHIIPRTFLDQYFATKPDVPRNVRNGASVNPFNFAPSERGLNAKRSSFAFDMDGDRVIRPFNLTLHPDSFANTGFDADHEWVIPSRNRGDVARAILYMVLVYGIDELYDRHLQTLIHWAKIDSPSAWELAYNDWVYEKYSIRNPFIDQPAKVLPLLNNSLLLHCAVCEVKEEVQ
ncbi:endonuclease [Thiofilum flexile]|uniref:endonuclease n=1 Tax=Thiofilum flexile TaxID=125627 RepID=UPI0003782253|nr:endonuclease [Thiofilum flexile]